MSIRLSWLFQKISQSMKKAHPSAVSLLLIMVFCLQVDIIVGEARGQLIEFKCGKMRQDNTTTFTQNFVRVMEEISYKMRTDGFGTIQIGTGPNANFGLAQCYGDLSLLDCALCYAEARIHLPNCFPFNAIRIYLDGCYVRTGNYSFYQEISGPDDKTICGNETRRSRVFQSSAMGALSSAVRDAPLNGGFARQFSRSINESAYVLANCWRTLNSSSCRACLENASASIMKCLPWSEGRAANTGCFLRYSDRKFLNAMESNSRGTKVSKGVIIDIVVGSVGFTLFGAFIGFCLHKKRKIQNRRRGSNDIVKMTKTLKRSRLNFKYSILQKATGYFDDANKLGQGGFGVVYKGILTDGREIAVKRLFVNNKYKAGDFFNEVNLISSLEHKNLVKLLGCSLFGPESILVYEFVPNTSLDRFLFDPQKGKSLDWCKRERIVVGIAKGLTYLHENKRFRIIHRDIKSGNVLLDQKFQPKISDFGLARTFEDGKSHISTRIAGTLGYMAPEYFTYGRLTEKVDVYSFGVLLVEIVTGRQNNGTHNDISESLIINAWKHFKDGTTEEIFDPNLLLQNFSNNNSMKNEVLRVLHIGLLCTQELPNLRPLMSTILQMLLRKDEELPAPTKPPFMDGETLELSYFPSVANISHTSFYPR